MKPVIKRALRTFFQTAIGYIAMNLTIVDWSDVSASKNVLFGLGVSAIAAGIAAIMNLDEVNKDDERH